MNELKVYQVICTDDIDRNEITENFSAPDFLAYDADDADKVIAEYQEKILTLAKSYKRLVKRFVHETSVAESYRSLIYKEDALKYQEAGNSEMYDELSKKSDKAYRHANRWRRIFRKMSQEADK